MPEFSITHIQMARTIAENAPVDIEKFQQYNFNWRRDDGTDTRGGATEISGSGVNIPLYPGKYRLAIHMRGGEGLKNCTLQYNITSSGWVDVSTSSSVVYAYDSPYLVDGEDSSQLFFTKSMDAYIGNNSGISEDGVAGPVLAKVNGEFKVEYPVVINTNFEDNDQISFRIKEAEDIERGITSSMKFVPDFGGFTRYCWYPGKNASFSGSSLIWNDTTDTYSISALNGQIVSGSAVEGLDLLGHHGAFYGGGFNLTASNLSVFTVSKQWYDQNGGPSLVRFYNTASTENFSFIAEVIDGNHRTRTYGSDTGSYTITLTGSIDMSYPLLESVRLDVSLPSGGDTTGNSPVRINGVGISSSVAGSGSDSISGSKIDYIYYGCANSGFGIGAGTKYEGVLGPLVVYDGDSSLSLAQTQEVEEVLNNSYHIFDLDRSISRQGTDYLYIISTQYLDTAHDTEYRKIGVNDFDEESWSLIEIDTDARANGRGHKRDNVYHYFAYQSDGGGDKEKYHKFETGSHELMLDSDNAAWASYDNIDSVAADSNKNAYVAWSSFSDIYINKFETGSLSNNVKIYDNVTQRKFLIDKNDKAWAFFSSNSAVTYDYITSSTPMDAASWSTPVQFISRSTENLQLRAVAWCVDYVHNDIHLVWEEDEVSALPGDNFGPLLRYMKHETGSWSDPETLLSGADDSVSFNGYTVKSYDKATWVAVATSSASDTFLYAAGRTGSDDWDAFQRVIPPNSNEFLYDPVSSFDLDIIQRYKQPIISVFYENRDRIDYFKYISGSTWDGVAVYDPSSTTSWSSNVYAFVLIEED